MHVTVWRNQKTSQSFSRVKCSPEVQVINRILKYFGVKLNVKIINALDGHKVLALKWIEYPLT